MAKHNACATTNDDQSDFIEKFYSRSTKKVKIAYVVAFQYRAIDLMVYYFTVRIGKYNVDISKV